MLELTDFSWLVLCIVSFVVGCGIGVLYSNFEEDGERDD